MTIKLFSDTFEMDSRCFAYAVLPDLDYDSQLISIRYLLRNNNRVDEEFHDEIKKIEEFARNTKGIQNEGAYDVWVDRVHASIYQSIAHSMSAVGMLAPLIESIFHQAFLGIKEKIFTSSNELFNHSRWRMNDSDKWNCHVSWGVSDKKEDLVSGIMELSDATGLKEFLPSDIELVLKVLFSYRNKMFHCGFEWPVMERKRFYTRIKTEKWPISWFEISNCGDDPWIICLSSEFIQHCIYTIDEIINSLGLFVKKNSQELRSNG